MLKDQQCNLLLLVPYGSDQRGGEELRMGVVHVDTRIDVVLHQAQIALAHGLVKALPVPSRHGNLPQWHGMAMQQSQGIGLWHVLLVILWGMTHFLAL